MSNHGCIFASHIDFKRNFEQFLASINFTLFIVFKLTEKYRGRFEDSKWASELAIVDKTFIVVSAPKRGHQFETLIIYLPNINLGLSRVKTIVKHLPGYSYKCILPILISFFTLNYYFAIYFRTSASRK